MDTGHVVQLPWLKPPLSLNDRKHWRVKAKETSEVVDAARWAIRAARIPKLEAAQVRLHWRIPDNRRRDLDNMAATLKPVIDALVLEGVIPDDDWTHVTDAALKIHPPDPTGPRIWLEVTPCNPA